MLLKKIPQTAKTPPYVSMSHGGVELLWDVKVIEQNKKNDKNQDPNEPPRPTPNPFEQLNQYFDQLPIPKQNELFQVYYKIHEILEPHAHDSIRDLSKRLPPLIKRIYELCPPDSVANWVRNSPSSIAFPANIRVYETLEESAKHGESFGLRARPPEATYVIPEYWGLVTLIMLVRMLTPIWGHFLANITEVVNNEYKEIYSLRLATKTALAETDGYKRLEEYVNIYLTPERFKNSAMEGSVPKEDAPFQTMAILLVRRMAWVDISGRDSGFNLVSFVYSFIETHLKGADRQYNDRVKPKVPDSNAAGGDQENRASVSELIKIREPYAAGDLTLPESTTRMPEVFINRMRPEMGPEWLRFAQETIKPFHRTPPLQVQFTILQNVLGAECRQKDGQWEVDPRFQERWDALFPPRAIDDMNLLEDLNMMAVGAALLCYRGFYDIAALMTASPQRDREGNSLGASAPPLEIQDVWVRQLQEQFPFSKRREKKRQSQTPSNVKVANVAVNWINDITMRITNYHWVLNIPEPWIKQLPDHDGSRRYTAKPNFRNRLAELAIAIATRNL